MLAEFVKRVLHIALRIASRRRPPAGGGGTAPASCVSGRLDTRWPGVLLVALLGATLPAQELLNPSQQAYLAALDQYLACNDDEAARLLGLVSGRYLDTLAGIEAARDLKALDPVRPWQNEPPTLKPSFRVKQLAAAILVHARLAGLSTRDRREEHAAMIADASEVLLSWEPPDDLAGPVYGLLAIRLHEDKRQPTLARLLAWMNPPYRRQLPALLATASLHELLSTPMTSIDPRLMSADPPMGGKRRARPLDEWGKTLIRVATRDKRGNRDRAIALYREATRLWPADAEAHLRLAFLLAEDGQLTEASAALAAAQPLSKPSVLGYFESLVSARIAERQSRLEDATAAYMRAAAIFPHAQTPLLAAARLLLFRGDASGARDVLKTRLPSTSRDQADDPWWHILFGQSWRRQEYLQRLNSLVRACG